MSGAVRRPVLRYHGGKWRLAPWIISHFPPHRVYVEPFGGAASVLMRKERSYAEVYNDLDGEIVNLFRVLRDPAHTAELERRLRLTPFARVEFEAAYEPSDDPIEQARRTLFRSFAGFGSAGIGRRTGFRALSKRNGPAPCTDWPRVPDNLAAVSARMSGVVIECLPAADVIRRYDSDWTLFYVDPPYPHGTRHQYARGDTVYRYEMADDDHRALAEVLRSVHGYVVLSGYPCELYDRELYPDWRRVERQAFADGGRRRTEVLWLSPRTAAALHPTLFEAESGPPVNGARERGRRA